MDNIPKEKILLLIAIIILFSLPFFWSDYELYHLGGDDSRFYYYKPWEFFKNIGLRSWFSPTGLSDFNFQFSYLPFTFLGAVISKFFNFQKVIYGFILSLGFYSTFLTVSSLISSKDEKKKFTASFLGGLFYIFMPLVFFTQWVEPIKSIMGIFLYPFLFLCFLKGVQARRVSFLILGAFASFLFSISMSSVPFLFPFFLFSFFFALFYFVLSGSFKRFLAYSLLYFLLIVGANSFWLVPFGYSVFGGSMWSSILTVESRQQEVGSIAVRAGSRSLADSVRGHFSFQALTRNNTSLQDLGLPNHYQSISFLGYFIPLLILISFFIKDKKKKSFNVAILLSAISFSSLLFLQVVNIGSWGIDLFQFLLRYVPGFVVIRTFYAKIPMAFSFFYSVLFGLSFYKVTQKLNIYKAIVLTLFFVFIVLIQAEPFISGTVNNFPIKVGSKLTRNVFFSDKYLDSLAQVKDFIGDDRFFLLPPTVGSYAFIKADNSNGLYIGTSPFKTLFGMEVFAGKRGLIGQGVLNVDKVMEKSLAEGNFDQIKKTFGLLGIRYFYLDNKAYDVSVDDAVKNQVLWPGNFFHTQKQTVKFVERLGFKKVKEDSDYSLYEFNNQDFVKKIYLPKEIVLAPSSKNYSLAEVLDKADSVSDLVFFFGNELGKNRELGLDSNLYISNNIGKYTLLERKEKMPVTDYKKITPELYQIDIKGAEDVFPLIFSERFNAGWKLYIVKNRKKLDLRGNISDYRNLLFQIPLSEESHFLANGYANAWFIDPQKDAGGAEDFEIILEFWPQRIFYLGILISVFTFLSMIVCLGVIFVKRKKGEKFNLERLEANSLMI